MLVSRGRMAARVLLLAGLALTLVGAIGCFYSQQQRPMDARVGPMLLRGFGALFGPILVVVGPVLVLLGLTTKRRSSSHTVLPESDRENARLPAGHALSPFRTSLTTTGRGGDTRSSLGYAVARGVFWSGIAMLAIGVAGLSIGSVLTRGQAGYSIILSVVVFFFVFPTGAILVVLGLIFTKRM